MNIDTKNFSWSTSFNISTNRNKVKKLATEDGRIVSDKFITEVGQPISSFYMMNVVGVFKDDADVAKGPVYSPNTRPGDLKYEDVDGLKARDIMSVSPKTIQEEELAYNAFQKMEQNSITQLVVVDEDKKYKGMVHIHDILREGVV